MKYKYAKMDLGSRDDSAPFIISSGAFAIEEIFFRRYLHREISSSRRVTFISDNERVRYNQHNAYHYTVNYHNLKLAIHSLFIFNDYDKDFIKELV